MVAATIFHNLVDGEVLQASGVGKNFAVACLSHPGCARDYDVGLTPGHF